MRIEGRKIIFDSGREIDANGGIIGLSPELEVSDGYDDHVWAGFEQESWRDKDQQFTAEELTELADHMIERWQAFRDRVAQRRSAVHNK